MEMPRRNLERERLRQLHLDREFADALQLDIYIGVAAALLDRGLEVLVDCDLGRARVGSEGVGDGVAHPAMAGAFLLALILRRARIVRDQRFALIPGAVRLRVGIVGEERDISRSCRLRLDIDWTFAQQAPRKRPGGRAASS